LGLEQREFTDFVMGSSSDSKKEKTEGKKEKKSIQDLDSREYREKKG